MKEPRKHNNTTKTFGRRIGKSLTATNKRVLQEVLPKYLYTLEKINTSSQKKIYLEIGFGMGEHFIHQILSNPDNLYIGAEVYLNGVANVLKNLSSDNFLIWPDDIDLILSDLLNNSISGVYILFPDPWHKRKYLPKRLLNQNRLNLLKNKLTDDGFISFASDIEDYFASSQRLLTNNNFVPISQDYSKAYDGYINTKYHNKAIKEERKVQFITSVLEK
ncbi:MAG: hypothetical protein AB8B66_05060 [Rickettsiaceae bacterium]